MVTTMTPRETPRTAAPVRTETPRRVPETPFFFGRLRDEFEHVMDRFARNWPMFWNEEERGWRWGLELKDEEEAVVLIAEAPGFEPEDFEIEVVEGRLNLKAARRIEVKKEEGTETTRHEYVESILLPPGIDREGAEATYHNGVLTIKMPKTVEAKGRHVPVKST
jgi:HSP20 family protein